MDEYTLYLDESEISVTDENKKMTNKLFIIGGIIVENNYHNTTLTSMLNRLKDNIWCEDKYEKERHGYILHEMEATHAHYGQFKHIKHKYHKIFAKPSKYKSLYDEMSILISSADIFTIGVCIKQTELHNIYKPNTLNDRKSILMQIMIENYYHFLSEHNACGKICYESMHENQNEVINKRYLYIRNTGTMFYPAKKVNKRILDLHFEEKDKNITGLQIADFIPNTLGRVECGKDSNSVKTYESVYNKLYNGNRKMINKFGFKIIP